MGTDRSTTVCLRSTEGASGGIRASGEAGIDQLGEKFRYLVRMQNDEVDGEAEGKVDEGEGPELDKIE